MNIDNTLLNEEDRNDIDFYENMSAEELQIEISDMFFAMRCMDKEIMARVERQIKIAEEVLKNKKYED